MLLSVSSKSPYKQMSGEIRCAANQLGTIFDFIKKNPNKRYNIIFQNGQDIQKTIEQLDYVKTIANDYTIECDTISALKAFLNAGYNAYLKFPVTDWETFAGLRDLKVSDIYIDGPLGFQIPLLEKAKHDTKLRITPTISPNASLSPPSANHFFVRPEDKELYIPTIDIFDLRQKEQEKEDALFSIYNRGTFNFDIDNLIENVPSGVNNTGLSVFCEKRLDCGQKCKTPVGHCKWCNTQFSIVEKALEYGKMKTN